jgi:hypothetical protein
MKDGDPESVQDAAIDVAREGPPNAFVRPRRTPHMAQFTESTIGKRVVDQQGIQVGTVDGVRDGTLYVEVGPDASAETVSELNWDGPVNREVHRLESQYVSTVTDDIVRLNV